MLMKGWRNLGANFPLAPKVKANSLETLVSFKSLIITMRKEACLEAQSLSCKGHFLMTLRCFS